MNVNSYWNLTEYIKNSKCNSLSNHWDFLHLTPPHFSSLRKQAFIAMKIGYWFLDSWLVPTTNTSFTPCLLLSKPSAGDSNGDVPEDSDWRCRRQGSRRPEVDCPQRRWAISQWSRRKESTEHIGEKLNCSYIKRYFKLMSAVSLEIHIQKTQLQGLLPLC